MLSIFNYNVPISTETYDINCHAGNKGFVLLNTNEAAALYGYNQSGWHTDPQNICTPIHYSNIFNPSSLANLVVSSIGYLTGLSNGEQIAFDILNPSNQNWASNSYSANGNGLEQKITLKAQIKKENSRID